MKNIALLLGSSILGGLMMYGLFTLFMPEQELSLPLAQMADEGQPSDEPLGQIAAAFAENGEKACLEKIDKISKFFIAGKSTAAVIIPRPQDNQQAMISFVLPVESQPVQSLVTNDFANSPRSGCAASYEAVSYWPQSCAEVRKSYFDAMQEIETSASGFTALTNGQGVHLFMMDAVQNCVTIKKENIP